MKNFKKELLRIGIQNCLFLLPDKRVNQVGLFPFMVKEIKSKLGEESTITLINQTNAKIVITRISRLEEMIRHNQGEYYIQRNCLKSFKLK